MTMNSNPKWQRDFDIATIKIETLFKKKGIGYIKTAFDKLFKKGKQLLRYSDIINKINNFNLPVPGPYPQ